MIFESQKGMKISFSIALQTLGTKTFRLQIWMNVIPGLQFHNISYFEEKAGSDN